MSVHQIVHTSRRCGLYGGGQGFGVLSSDRDYPENDSFGELLYGYKAPELGADIAVTEKIIACLPAAYTYRAGKQYSAFTRSGALGADPFGGGSNHISHSILFEKGELTAYPCELIGSPSFLQAPPDDAVYAADGVAYMPEPTVLPSGTYTINKVMKFLAKPGNFEIFKNMLWALMHGDERGRKIIICDEEENTALWIAALDYSMPRPFAQRVSFTTYAYDPEAAKVDVCGVTSKCTAYNDSFASSDKYFVFDIPAGVCFDMPELTYAEGDYFAFLEEALLHDYGRLQLFHSYLERYTDLEKISPDIAGAFVMCRASGVFAGVFSSVSAEEFDAISEFSGKNARYGGKLLLAESVLAVSETVLSFGPQFVEKLLVYIAGIYKDASVRIKAGFRALAVDSVPVMMISKDATSASFEKYYKNVSALCDFCEIDLCDELVAEKNREALLFVIKYQHLEWKVNFVLGLISEYVHKHNAGYESLMPASSLGKFLSAAAAERYKCGDEEEAPGCILTPYADGVKRFCAVHENLSALKFEGGGKQRREELDAAFSKIAAEKLTEQRRELFNFLSESEKYGLMHQVFCEMMNACDIKKLTALFDEHYSEYFTVCPPYEEAYLREAAEEYYAIFKAKKNDGIKEAEEELFGILLTNEMTVPSSAEITAGLISRLKMAEPGKDTEKRIKELQRYTCEILGAPLTGKLLCLVFGVKAKQAQNRKDFAEIRPELAALAADERVDLTKFSEDEAEAYLKWVLPSFTANLRAPDIAASYDMFVLATPASVEFTSQFCKALLSEGRNDSDYSNFCEFLRFVFTRLGIEELQEVSYQVHKMNQKRLDQLKEDAKAAFANDYTLMEKFDNMMEATPKRRSIFDIFKK